MLLAHEHPFQVEMLFESHPLPEGTFVITHVEDRCIGIPRHVLQRAAHAAWLAFFHESATHEDQFHASSILLLLNPEHLTAANFRKRFVMAARNNVEKQRRISNDLCFLESLFVSSLHRHTKSPTLWAHRKWLTRELDSSIRVPEISSSEIIICLLAAETHPKNVYAWQYLRYFMSNNLQWTCLSYAGTEKGPNLTNNQPNLGPEPVIAYFLAWCLQHPSDTSGWSFLLWMLTMAQKSSMTRYESAQSPLTIFREVLQKAKAFGLKNESLWTFLRTLANRLVMPISVLAEFHHTARETLSGSRDVARWLSSPTRAGASQSIEDSKR
ncbi:MAG: hypothetical protein M1818_005400 [Claussenomyces sp. TS43310]|nr:MAG: hypothetical protein M1818_005400 [Claussenomyces sp. TS43310]